MFSEEDDFLRKIPMQEKDTTIPEWSEKGKGHNQSDQQQQQQGIKNGSNNDDNNTSTSTRHDVHATLHITNKSTANDVDLLINNHEFLVRLAAGEYKPIQLPQNIRYFRLRNSMSGAITPPLPFNDEYRHITVQDFKYGSDLLDLLSKDISLRTF